MRAGMYCEPCSGSRCAHAWVWRNILESDGRMLGKQRKHGEANELGRVKDRLSMAGYTNTHTLKHTHTHARTHTHTHTHTQTHAHAHAHTHARARMYTLLRARPRQEPPGDGDGDGGALAWQ
jgi:hypothetical protein